MKRLDVFTGMIVSKYFASLNDFIAFEQVCTKFKNTLNRFHINPIPITKKMIKHFPQIETLNIWNKTDEHFGYQIFTKENAVFSNITEFNFYKVNIWYQVEFGITQFPQNNIFVFKKVCLTRKDRELLKGDIPTNVMSLETSCYADENSLTSITLPPTVYNIGDNCFFYCKNLLEVNISGRIEHIGMSCFDNCRQLSAVTFLVCLGELPEHCFNGCRSLKEISVPKGITELGESCFGHCDNLSKIVLPNSLKIIYRFCFQECKSLKEVTLPPQIENIYWNAFLNCRELSRINFPKSLKSIGQICFQGCVSLKEVCLYRSTEFCKDSFTGINITLIE
ncbi:hypothetical protein EIN_116460 [Entamoeba invadens IP1]|uniref:Leucine rich repeat containing protein BspA family protein n=1 Tax=Entamoeba invadens IP1 TaxID=370355 RepID=L7FPD7_ENTIV|nr:hypothetical protein EIN_116460 [Entamoeba invadens IP1]ELP94535.1 hypothetical protein EIN_116460 [Entamoeba invadens IP1]|eukprot:XP_004261306.1 hypothetical protein EIN_116460 [Entamoeba invadens IP1]